MAWMERGTALGAILAMATTGCGGSDDGESVATGARPGGGQPTGGAATGGTGARGDTSGSCPASPPATGDACTPPWVPVAGALQGTPAAHCTWGDDPRLECRTRGLCADGAWQISEPDCGPLLPAACPTTAAADGSNCTDATVSCWYDDGTRCSCSECAGGSPYPVCMTVDPPQWACVAQAAGVCPYPLPQAGSACDGSATSCGTSCSSPFQCVDGLWQWFVCPSCCPICASPDTPIATPAGERPIAELVPGDLVYSVEGEAIVVVPVVRVGRTRVTGHRVVRVTLDQGTVIEMSAGHPTFDGRRFGELRVGERFDDTHRVVALEVIPYEHDATYDILPASTTATYYAAGALVGSTLN